MDYKIECRHPVEMQKVLNQWKHDYNLVIESCNYIPETLRDQEKVLLIIKRIERKN